MKKLRWSGILILAILIIGGCQKSSVDEVPQIPEVSHELGALLLPPLEYAKLPMVETINLKSAEALPTSVALNTLPVGDQGGEGSCVAWGTTYAGRSITWVKDHSGEWSQSANIFSPEYVYNQIKVKKQCSSGAYTKDGLDLLKSQGVCTWKSMPYTDVSCNTMPTASQKTEAALYKIKSYATVPITTDAIKTQLAAGLPVIVAGPVDRNFMYLAKDAVLTVRGVSLGGHCYCVVGYDDAKTAFKFQNSWGTSWASAGFGWINYNNITSWWQEAYVLTN
jgi:C1A family cysteine protease